MAVRITKISQISSFSIFSLCLVVIGIIYILYYIYCNHTNNNRNHSRISSHKRPIVVVNSKDVLLQRDINGEWKYDAAQADTLKAYIPYIDLYIITQVRDESEQDQLYTVLMKGGITSGLDPENTFRPSRLLFCQTDRGVYSMTRQLQATYFFDYVIPVILGNEVHLNDLKNFVPNTIDYSGHKGFDELEIWRSASH